MVSLETCYCKLSWRENVVLGLARLTSMCDQATLVLICGDFALLARGLVSGNSPNDY